MIQLQWLCQECGIAHMHVQPPGSLGDMDMILMCTCGTKLRAMAIVELEDAYPEVGRRKVPRRATSA